jgi:pimeloyl-ACP methyl ester carboxylesterase
MERFTTFDGIGIAYQRWGEPAAGGLPPVLLHHGFVVDANVNWVATGIVKALLEAGREVIAPDARGHGASDKPHDPAAYGESKMARDLGVLLDTLALERIDLAGYSMGAIVALLLSAGDPRVRRLVVGGVGSGVVECGGVDRRHITRGSVDGALLADDPATVEDPGARAFRTLADAVGADREALAAQAASIHRDGVALDRIVAPALVFAGAGDPLATRPQVLADAIPDARLEILDGDHLGVFGDPRLAPLIAGFLA